MQSIGFLVIICLTIFYEKVDGQTQLPQYSTRWNNLNIDQILSSDRLVTNYVECLLSRKPCPPEGKDLKRILPEALRTKCARCSRQQLEGGLRVITKLYYDYPTQYNRLRAKWDPTGEYHRRFEEYLRGLQFNSINNEPSGTNLNAPKNSTIFASASSNSQSIVPTTPPASVAQFNNTQRPARNPGNVQSPNVNRETTVAPDGVFNRFAGADDDDKKPSDPVMKSSTTTTTTTERALPTLAAVPAQRTTKRPKVSATTQPDIVYIQQQHPLIGLINSIGFKISNTADFFAGMLRGTIQKQT